MLRVKETLVIKLKKQAPCSRFLHARIVLVAVVFRGPEVSPGQEKQNIKPCLLVLK